MALGEGAPLPVPLREGDKEPLAVAVREPDREAQPEPLPLGVAQGEAGLLGEALPLPEPHALPVPEALAQPLEVGEAQALNEGEAEAEGQPLPEAEGGGVPDGGGVGEAQGEGGGDSVPEGLGEGEALAHCETEPVSVPAAGVRVGAPLGEADSELEAEGLVEREGVALPQPLAVTEGVGASLLGEGEPEEQGVAPGEGEGLSEAPPVALLLVLPVELPEGLGVTLRVPFTVGEGGGGLVTVRRGEGLTLPLGEGAPEPVAAVALEEGLKDKLALPEAECEAQAEA